MLSLVLSSDSHVFEPPDLWQTCIDRAFRDRLPASDVIEELDRGPLPMLKMLSGASLPALSPRFGESDISRRTGSTTTT